MFFLRAAHNPELLPFLMTHSEIRVNGGRRAEEAVGSAH